MLSRLVGSFCGSALASRGRNLEVEIHIPRMALVATKRVRALRDSSLSAALTSRSRVPLVKKLVIGVNVDKYLGKSYTTDSKTPSPTVRKKLCPFSSQISRFQN